MNVKQLVPPIFITLYNRITTYRKNISKIGKYDVEFHPNSAFPLYRKTMKLYDRLLPVLAKHLPPGKLVIDVGANVGDTAIAILQNCENPILCVEPSDVYIKYLEKNLNKLSSGDSNRIKISRELIGTGTLSGELVHAFGTANLKVGETPNKIDHVTLDDLIDDNNEVILLKVDTDGFDFDVLNSAGKLLSDSEPILFWENEITEDFQYKGFEELYDLLTEKGYKYIYIFDNFGNLITEEADFKTLKNINSYVYGMSKYECTRTIYFTDILAATEKNYLIVEKTIDEYKNEWIKK